MTEPADAKDAASAEEAAEASARATLREVFEGGFYRAPGGTAIARLPPLETDEHTVLGPMKAGSARTRATGGARGPAHLLNRDPRRARVNRARVTDSPLSLRVGSPSVQRADVLHRLLRRGTGTLDDGRRLPRATDRPRLDPRRWAGRGTGERARRGFADGRAWPMRLP